MGETRRDDLTGILQDLRNGAPSAQGVLMERVYEELHALARAFMRRESPGTSIQATDLIHEAYLKLIDQCRVDVRDRVHFFALAAQVMRRLLVDRARRRRAEKRGGGAGRVGLSGADLGTAAAPVDVLDLNDALVELAALDERQGRIVELRSFGGLECAEVAEHLGVSTRTVEREWRAARAWLRARLEAIEGP